MAIKSNGFIVSFEGIEKSGKETQSLLLKDFLQKKGVPHTFGREPGGTSYGEAERRSMQDPTWISRVNKAYPDMRYLDITEKLCSFAEIFGYLKARAQLFDSILLPAIKNKQIIVLDRSGDSSVAYQGFGLFNGKKEIVDFIKKNNNFAMHGLKIKRTWFLDVSVDEMFRRKDHWEFGKNKDRIEQREKEFFSRVRRGYFWLAKQEPKRFRIIDGTKGIEEIQTIIRRDMEELLNPMYKNNQKK